MGTGQKGCTCGGLFVCAESAAFGTSEKPLKGPLKSRSYGAQSSRGVNVSPPWVGTVLGFKPRPGGFLPWFGLVLQVFAPEREETDKQNRPDARWGGEKNRAPLPRTPSWDQQEKTSAISLFLPLVAVPLLPRPSRLLACGLPPPCCSTRAAPVAPLISWKPWSLFLCPLGRIAPQCCTYLFALKKKRGPDYCAWCNIFRGAGVTGPQAWG